MLPLAAGRWWRQPPKGEPPSPAGRLYGFSRQRRHKKWRPKGRPPRQRSGTIYLPRAEALNPPVRRSRSQAEPWQPRAKGPAAGSTLTPVRACQPTGILESTAPKGACPLTPQRACPSLTISADGSILSFGTYACIGRIGASPWGELKMTWTGSQLIPVS